MTNIKNSSKLTYKIEVEINSTLLEKLAQIKSPKVAN